MSKERESLGQRLKSAAGGLLARTFGRVADEVQDLGRRTRAAADGAAGLLERLSDRIQRAGRFGLPANLRHEPAASSMSVRPSSERSAEPAAPTPAEGGPFDTETMADLYLRQGLYDRARRIYESLLAREPDNGRLRQKLERLEIERRPTEVHVPDEGHGFGSSRFASSPHGTGDGRPQERDPAHVAPEAHGSSEPFGLLDWREPPRGYDENTICLLPVEPELLYCYYEVTPGAIDAARAQAGVGPYGQANLVLRLHRTVVTDRGPETETTDHEIHDRIGSFYFRLDRSGGRARVAIGVRGPDGRFASAAHSDPVMLQASSPSLDTREEWLEVEAVPGRRNGKGPWPIRILRRGGRTGQAAAGFGERSHWNDGRWYQVQIRPPVPAVRIPGSSEVLPPQPPEHEWRFLGASEMAGERLKPGSSPGTPGKRDDGGK